MAINDVEVLGPFDRNEIDTALTGNVLVGDNIVAVSQGSNKVLFIIVKSA